MGPVPPGNGGERLNELLAQIRSEFESQMRATESFEHQSKQQQQPLEHISNNRVSEQRTVSRCSR